MKRFLLVILVLFLYFGCKTDSAKDDLQQALREFEPTTQIFKINSDSLAELQGKNGTILKIDPSVLQHLDGSSVTSEIEVRLMELTTTEDLLRANAQTVSNEKWLISAGAYQIQIFSDYKELKIADGKSIEVNFPKIASEEMQLFDGNRDAEGNINWEISNQVLKGKSYPVLMRIDSSFMRYNRQFAIDMPVDSVVLRVLNRKFTLENFKKEYIGIDSTVIESDTIKAFKFDYILFEMGEIDTALIKKYPRYHHMIRPKVKTLITDLYETISISKLGWINVDRFYPEITERVRFEIIADIDLDYVQMYAADAENNTLLNLFEDVKGVVTFDAPLGKRFTIIAFGIKDEQIYGYKKSVLIEKDAKHQIKYRKADKQKMEDYFKLD